MNKKSNGFTLIELLVVIAIMGLLASIAVVALNNARADARDAKRLADMDAVQNALELYYQDHGFYPNYDCYGLVSVIVCASTINPNNWIPSLTPDYIQSMPNDPLNLSNPELLLYAYTRDIADPDIASQRYYLLFKLENQDPINDCGDLPFGASDWSARCGGNI